MEKMRAHIEKKDMLAQGYAMLLLWGIALSACIVVCVDAHNVIHDIREQESIPDKKSVSAYTISADQREKANAKLMHAVTCGKSSTYVQQEVCAALQEGATVDVIDRAGWTPLMHAVCYGHTQIAALLLDAGASVDRVSHEGTPLLMMAINAGRVDLVSLLLEKKVKVRGVMQKNGDTPLHCAVRVKPELVRILLEHAADVNAVNNDGYTPLHGAIIADQYEAVQLLLQYKAHINVSDHNGMTPLMWSAWKSNHDMVMLLLHSEGSYGCAKISVDAVEKYGCSALTFAVLRKNEAIISSLILAGADTKKEKVRLGRNMVACAYHKDVKNEIQVDADMLALLTGLEALTHHHNQQLTFKERIHQKYNAVKAYLLSRLIWKK